MNKSSFWCYPNTPSVFAKKHHRLFTQVGFEHTTFTMTFTTTFFPYRTQERTEYTVLTHIGVYG